MKRLALLAVLVLAAPAVSGCQVEAEAPETEMVSDFSNIRCETLEDWTRLHISVRTKGPVIEECSFWEGVGYLSKRAKIDGKPYVCVRLKGERTCQWAEDEWGGS